MNQLWTSRVEYPALNVATRISSLGVDGPSGGRLAEAVHADLEPLRREVVLPEEAHLVVEALAELHGVRRGVVPLALEGEALGAERVPVVRREVQGGREELEGRVGPVLCVGDLHLVRVVRAVAVPDEHLRPELVLVRGEG